MTIRSFASEYMNSASKRALDLGVVSLFGGFALAGGLVGAMSQTPQHRRHPLFIQQRAGKGNEDFLILKLRTMHDTGQIAKGGTMIRRLGLDELPQMINVARGDMSAVGYRPLLREDLNYAVGRLRAHFTTDSPYHPDRWLTLREQCSPGITGPSQTMDMHPRAGSIDHLAAVVASECTYMETGTFASDIKYLTATPKSLLYGHNPTVTRMPEEALFPIETTLKLPSL